MQILHTGCLLVNMHMRTLLHISLLYSLVGCANVSSTIDNGIGQVPGQRVHVNSTVYRW